MKYLSDTGRKFNTEAEALADQKEFSEKKIRKEQERASRAREVEQAHKKMLDARESYKKAYEQEGKLLNDFCKDFGFFHTSMSVKDAEDFVQSFFAFW